MRITVLGSASGISMPGRGHASIAVEAGSGLYLFDLGEPVGRTLLELALPLERLTAAFVSHMHSDHSGGLFQFVKNLHLYHNHPDYLPQVERMTLALPAEAVGAVKAFMAACYMFDERLRVRLEYLGVERGPVYEDENIAVTAHPTSHLAGYEDFIAAHPEYGFLECQSFAYEAVAEGRRILYSGDLGDVRDIIPAAQGADLLILEFGHLLPLEQNLKRLAPLGIRKIVITHIFPDYNDRGEQLQRIADGILPGIVTVARDGYSVEL